jgi:uncharacterized protein with gpF-like domain
MEIPKLDNWKEKLQIDLESIGNKREDVQKIIEICDRYDHEIKEVFQWFSDQSDFVQQIKIQYFNLYQIRFNNPPQSEKTENKTNKIILHTKQEKRGEVRKIAIELTKSGEQISSKVIYDSLLNKGMDLDSEKPIAVISTIMWGYKEEFEQIKTKGKKGIFKRKQPHLSLKPSDAI